MTATMQQSSDPDRKIPVRRIDFEETFSGLDRNFAGGDLIVSHLMAVLSGVFPDGEEMFVDSVRHYRGQVTDPDLLRQVNAFIGQETMHSREHRRLNDRLDELGFRAKLVERTMEESDALSPGMRRIVELATRIGPLRSLRRDIEDSSPVRPVDAAELGDETLEAGRASPRPSGYAAHVPDPLFLLALTAALEHFTATIATFLLSDPELDDLIVDDGFMRFWIWHAIEENEHKAVAFDVYKAIGGDEETRVRALKLSGWALGFIAGYHTVAGVLRDRRTWTSLGLPRSLRRLRRNPLLSRRFRRIIADYKRSDFHPLDHDTTALEDRWKPFLAGEGPRP